MLRSLHFTLQCSFLFRPLCHKQNLKWLSRFTNNSSYLWNISLTQKWMYRECLRKTKPSKRNAIFFPFNIKRIQLCCNKIVAEIHKGLIACCHVMAREANCMWTKRDVLPKSNYSKTHFSLYCLLKDPVVILALNGCERVARWI